MAMTITHKDGSVTVLETDADIRLYMELTGQIVPPKVATTAEKVAEALAAVRGVEVSSTPERAVSVVVGGDNPVLDAAVMPDSVDPEKPKVERVGPGLRMPAKIDVPPTAWLTSSQHMVLELLRHHPLGLTTAEIAEKLRWNHAMATHRVSYMHRNVANNPERLVDRIGNQYRYRISDFGRRARLEIVGQPSRHQADDKVDA